MTIVLPSNESFIVRSSQYDTFLHRKNEIVCIFLDPLAASIAASRTLLSEWPYQLLLQVRYIFHPFFARPKSFGDNDTCYSMVNPGLYFYGAITNSADLALDLHTTIKQQKRETQNCYR